MPSFRLFMRIVKALWLIAATIDRDSLNAVAWFGFVAAGVLTASGATERSRRWLTNPSHCRWLSWPLCLAPGLGTPRLLVEHAGPLSSTPYSHHVI